MHDNSRLANVDADLSRAGSEPAFDYLLNFTLFDSTWLAAHRFLN
jgi:hypothetical protein